MNYQLDEPGEYRRNLLSPPVLLKLHEIAEEMLKEDAPTKAGDNNDGLITEEVKKND